MSYSESPPLPPTFDWLPADAATRIKGIRASVQPVLTNNLFNHFTDHSVQHSDGIVNLIDQLVANLQSTPQRLSPDELVIVYAAAYLHDIGLHYENCFQLLSTRNLVDMDSWGALDDVEKKNMIRNVHHLIAADIIMDNAITQSLKLQFPPQLRGQIACLCEAHCVDVQSTEYRKLTKNPTPKIRMALLSGILRIADILDESYRRAPEARRNSLALTLEAKTHWWRHAYTKDVHVDNVRNCITFTFEFPHTKGDTYQQIIPAMQLPIIQNEVASHTAAFAPVNLNFLVEYAVVDSQYSAVEEMPDEVYSEIVSRMYHAKEQRRQGERLQSLRVYDLARSGLQNRITAARTIKNSQERLRELIKIATDYSSYGAQQFAVNIVYNEFVDHCALLTAEHRIEFALLLVKWLHFSNDYERAVRALDAVEVASSGNTDWRILERKAESLFLMGHVATSLQLFSTAHAEAPQQLKGLVQARVDEIMFFELVSKNE